MRRYLFSILLAMALVIGGCDSEAPKKEEIKVEQKHNEATDAKEDTIETKDEVADEVTSKSEVSEVTAIDLSNIPEYSGQPYVVINNNEPYFTELTTESYEYYSDLDSLGRCGVAHASIGIDLMPTEKRGPIGSVKPSGWHTVKYDCVDGKYLYNRCHLIGFQLTGENANARNLITGTRYLNVDGMLPFENMVDDYIEETGNHVMYRVTPIYDGNNLVASGVLMEAKSVEDNGDGILFNVYCYNVQPGVEINYADGSSSGPEVVEKAPAPQSAPAPQVAPQAAPTVSEQTENTVWISSTGKKYHSINNCGRMNPAKASSVTESKAQGLGLEKCQKCW